MRVLIFGATGSAGRTIAKFCLAEPAVTEVRTLTRRRPDLAGPKLTAVMHSDFLDYSQIADVFAGLDACLFCLGVSSTQVSGEEYRRISYEFPLAAARRMLDRSPGASFHYISGMGTNPQGRLEWARVKGQAELDLMKLCGAVCWRPAAIGAEPSDRAPWMLKAVYPLFGLLKPFRSLYVSGEDFARAMLQATREGMRSRIVENAGIREIAGRWRG